MRRLDDESGHLCRGCGPAVPEVRRTIHPQAPLTREKRKRFTVHHLRRAHRGRMDTRLIYCAGRLLQAGGCLRQQHPHRDSRRRSSRSLLHSTLPLDNSACAIIRVSDMVA
ncbi:hypothetical protein IQ06DRAFT_119484 [Phaeosphaeriaceae sp. SRC1lsM3a]|nr:hypothetical protein IQ06DRAFT_119484 [Stagonospora sp. SRC1lsM3a]